MDETERREQFLLFSKVFAQKGTKRNSKEMRTQLSYLSTIANIHLIIITVAFYARFELDLENWNFRNNVNQAKY